MKIVVGLGNPGSKYKNNRHNIGFRCIQRLSGQHSIPVKRNLCQSFTGEGTIEGNTVLLVMPKTFVNLSGNAVFCLMRKFKCEPQDIIVIHDDLDLATGKLRIRMGGKSGGHRGIRSIISSLETDEFIRIRIGISRPLHNQDGAYDDAIVDYVLGDLSPQEDNLISNAIEIACQAISVLLREGLDTAMNKFNRRSEL